MDYFVERDSKTAKKYRFELFSWNLPANDGYCAKHMHSAIEILYFLKGRCQINFVDKSVEASAGDMVLIRSNVIHSMTNIGTTSADYYVLKLHPRLLFHILSGGHEKFTLFYLNGNSAGKTLFTAHELRGSVIAEMWQRGFTAEYHQDGITALKSRAFCAEMIVQILHFCDSEKSNADIAVSQDKIRRIYSSTAFIDEHYMDDITALDCAKAANMSYSLFSQCFKAIMGKSVKQHLTEIRLTHAQNMLLTTFLSITEISALVGYNNASHFIQEFKKQYGTTPKFLRKTRDLSQSNK